MRRRRLAILLILYIVVFLLTIVMESISINNQSTRLLVNVCTIVMLIISGILFWIIYKIGQNEERTEIPKENKKVFDKEKYLELSKKYELTKREKEIGLLILNGYSNAQIAEELYIAESTVKKHTSHIYEKVGVSGRKEFKLLMY